MVTTTTNYALYMYNATTDQAETFADFRADIAGTAAASNMMKLDTALDDHDTEIAALQAKKNIIAVDAAYSSGTLYTATVSEITAYADNDVIDIVLDIDMVGTTTLQINSLAVKSMMKINTVGTAINLVSGDLKAERHYLFSFDLAGDKWVWVNSQSADQIWVSGIAGDFVTISSTNGIETAGVAASDFTENTDANVKTNTWVIDEDDLTSDLDTKVPTQQSVKAYVDGKVSSQFRLLAKEGTPSTTGGCANPSQVEFTTYDVDLWSCAFDGTNSEYVQWSHPLPSDYGGGTVTYFVYWYCANVSTAAAVWALQATALGETDALDAAWGTEQIAGDANNGNAVLNITPAASAITIANTPVAGDMVQWRLRRYPEHGTDLLTAIDTNLLWVTVNYTRT